MPAHHLCFFYIKERIFVAISQLQYVYVVVPDALKPAEALLKVCRGAMSQTYMSSSTA